LGFPGGQSIYGSVVAFLWAFAFWGILYYVWLHGTIGWPDSFLDTDVLS